MIIVMGFFNVTYFRMAKENGWMIFEEFSSVIKSDLGQLEFESVMYYVHEAYERATHINFLLDDIHLPLRQKLSFSFTAKELDLLLSNHKYIEKCTFWLHGEQLDKFEVLQLLSNNSLTGIIADHLIVLPHTI